MKKHIESPQRFIHYCIHCAMPHEEEEMQEVMGQFLSDEREKGSECVYCGSEECESVDVCNECWEYKMNFG